MATVLTLHQGGRSEAGLQGAYSRAAEALADLEKLLPEKDGRLKSRCRALVALFELQETMIRSRESASSGRNRSGDANGS